MTISNDLSPQALVLVGAGGHARELIWVAREADQPWVLLGCLDDAEALQGQTICDVPVLGRVSEWRRFADAHFVVAVGSPRTRRVLVERLSADHSPRFATLIHRSVVRSAYVEIGVGSVVMAGCILSTQVRIGCHAILNQHVTVAHDVFLEDYATLAPGVTLSGNVHACAGAELGTASCVRQGLRIGRGAMVGMGAVVVRDVDDRDLVTGNPAKPRRQLDLF